MRLIDADRLLQRTKFYNLKNGNRAIDEIDILHAQTVKAIPVPNNATNRDMIKAIFPNATFMIDEEKDEQGTKNLYVYTDDFEGFTVDLDWWNAPYKGVEND